MKQYALRSIARTRPEGGDGANWHPAAVVAGRADLGLGPVDDGKARPSGRTVDAEPHNRRNWKKSSREFGKGEAIVTFVVGRHPAKRA